MVHELELLVVRYAVTGFRDRTTGFGLYELICDCQQGQRQNSGIRSQTDFDQDLQ